MDALQYISLSKQKSQKAIYHKIKLHEMEIKENYNNANIPDFESISKTNFGLSFKPFDFDLKLE